MIIFNDDWHFILFDYVRSVGDSVYLFWIFLILTGEFFLMKLFFALFLNTYIELLKERGSKIYN